MNKAVYRWLTPTLPGPSCVSSPSRGALPPHWLTRQAGQEGSDLGERQVEAFRRMPHLHQRESMAKASREREIFRCHLGDRRADADRGRRCGRRRIQHMDHPFRLDDAKIIHQGAVGFESLGADA